LEKGKSDPITIRATSVSIGKDCPPIVEFYKEYNKMVNNNRLRLIFDGLTRCGRNKQYIEDQDVITFDRRCTNEGAEFYARGFTSLRTALLNGLECGFFDMADLRFKKKRGSLLPMFCYNAWIAIFDDSGSLRHNIDIDAVACLNQLLASFGKIEGGHTLESEQECLDRFLEVEEEVSKFVQTADATCAHYKWALNGDQGRSASDILDQAKVLLSWVLADQDPRDLHPSHGSGVSACRTPIHRRYERPRYVSRIDKIWSYSDYYFLGASHLCDEMVGRKEASPSNCTEVLLDETTQTHLDDLEEYIPCAQVLLVPKDARGPRIISCEPRETMWIQQGAMRKLVTCAEAHPFTQGLVSFTDQTKNQQLAFLGSITQEFATLDLKDASDRISLWLVGRVWPENWVDALIAMRSHYTRMPDGTVVSLSKHAPMGSATCFPVMALTIWAILTAATNMSRGLPRGNTYDTHYRDVSRKLRENPVYVYGDDIILPTVFADQAVGLLQAVGLAVNTKKSFSKGFFRESCGKEYYRGVDITPVRMRSMPEDDVPSRMKTIAFHNNIYEKYGIQPDWMTQLIHEWYPKVPEKTIRLHENRQGQLYNWSIPTLESNLWGSHEREEHRILSGVLNVYRADNSRLPWRWNARLHRREYRFLTVVPRYNKYNVDRWSQVFRALVNPRTQIAFGRDALSKRVAYKYRWAQL
jgi:hypothetical protein